MSAKDRGDTRAHAPDVLARLEQGARAATNERSRNGRTVAHFKLHWASTIASALIREGRPAEADDVLAEAVINDAWTTRRREERDVNPTGDSGRNSP